MVRFPSCQNPHNFLTIRIFTRSRSHSEKIITLCISTCIRLSILRPRRRFHIYVRKAKKSPRNADGTVNTSQH